MTVSIRPLQIKILAALLPVIVVAAAGWAAPALALNGDDEQYGVPSFKEKTTDEGQISEKIKEETKVKVEHIPDEDGADEDKAAEAEADAEDKPHVRRKEPSSRSVPSGPAHGESIGLLTSPQQGSLGIDMWDGSERSTIASLLQSAPSTSLYRSTQGLMRRLLLTNADASLMSGRANLSAGEDMLTLRLEKLNDMGAFNEASSLYAEIPGEPWHERLIRAGVTAMMYNGQTALACLEINAQKDKFASAEPALWAGLLDTCSYLLSKMGGAENMLTPSSGGEDDAAAAPQSEILKQMIHKDNFRITLKSGKDLEGLSLLDKATLVADGRVDYSQSKKLSPADLDPATRSILLHDKNMPDLLYYRLVLASVRQGNADIKVLSDLYLDTAKAANKSAYGDVKGWQRLAWLYKDAKTARGQALNDDIARVLAFRSEYGQTALLPFGASIGAASPAGLPADPIRTALQTLVQSGERVPDSWVESWKAVRSADIKDVLLDIAIDVATNFSTDIISVDSGRFSSAIKALPPSQSQLIRALYENLDKNGRLKEYGGEEVYEKQLDLTNGSDYVMPSTGLMDSLVKARNDRRPGEVILAGSIALHDVPPANLYAGLLREVLNGFGTVGLTKEAKQLTTEVVLGLSRKD